MNENQTALPDGTQSSDKLLSMAEVRELVPVGKDTLRKLCQDPVHPFPAPVRVGRLIFWRLSDINQWMRTLPGEVA